MRHGGRAGKAWDTPPTDPDADADLEPITPTPLSMKSQRRSEQDKPFQMLVTALAQSEKVKPVLAALPAGH